MDQSEIDILKTLIERAGTVESLDGRCQPFVIVPEAHKVQSLECLLTTPSRKTGCPVFTQADSFCGYVNEQKDADSRLYVTGPTAIVAVLNHHGKTADWKDHKATLALTKTPEWITWTNFHNKFMGQREFAQFIEDNAADLASPTGADLLDLVRTIKLSQHLECTGEIDERGDVAGTSFVVATKTKTGAKQEVELPAEFFLAISPYEGGDKSNVKSRLRIELDGTRFKLRYELVKIATFEKLALESIVAGVAAKTDMDPWYGTP